jgi:hypothetical protein
MSDYQMTENKIQRWIADGRGQGRLGEYRPWLTISDVPSKGRRERCKGIKANRTHHLFSKNEGDVFCIFDLSTQIIDIREQYPLPREETELIARDLNIKHPCDPTTKVNIVMTSDFRITVSIGGYVMDVVRTVKEIADLNGLRTVEKLEIERIYYLNHGIDWGIIIPEHISKILKHNCRYYWDYHSFDKLQIDEKDLHDIHDYLEPLLLKKDTALRLLARQCDKRLDLSSGTSLKGAIHFIATRRWIIDWNNEFNTGHVLNILN